MDSIFYCFVADILPRFLSKKCSYNQQGSNSRSNRFKNVNLENGVYAEYKDNFISMRFSRTAKIYPQFWKFRKASQVEKWNKTIQKNHSFKCSVVTISPNLISSYLCPLNVISAVQKNHSVFSLALQPFSFKFTYFLHFAPRLFITCVLVSLNQSFHSSDKSFSCFLFPLFFPVS